MAIIKPSRAHRWRRVPARSPTALWSRPRAGAWGCRASNRRLERAPGQGKYRYCPRPVSICGGRAQL